MKVNETVKLLESGGARTLMAQLYGEYAHYVRFVRQL